MRMHIHLLITTDEHYRPTAEELRKRGGVVSFTTTRALESTVGDWVWRHDNQLNLQHPPETRYLWTLLPSAEPERHVLHSEHKIIYTFSRG